MSRTSTASVACLALFSEFPARNKEYAKLLLKGTFYSNFNSSMSLYTKQQFCVFFVCVREMISHFAGQTQVKSNCGLLSFNIVCPFQWISTFRKITFPYDKACCLVLHMLLEWVFCKSQPARLKRRQGIILRWILVMQVVKL